MEHKNIHSFSDNLQIYINITYNNLGKNRNIEKRINLET